MNEVMERAVNVAAIVIYEQWGWPVLPMVLRGIEEHLRPATIIWDRVDSCHFRATKRTETPSGVIYELVSLGKLLGLPGGGLLVKNGEYAAAPRPIPCAVTEYLLRAPAQLLSTFECSEYFRNHAEVPHPEVTEWLRTFDVWEAMDRELLCRRGNLAAITASGLARDWPAWMNEAEASGAGPGIAPLFRGTPRNQLEQAACILKRKIGVETAVYNFNWSGNPLDPDYDICLAFPLHGQIDVSARIIGLLKSIASDHPCGIDAEAIPTRDNRMRGADASGSAESKRSDRGSAPDER
jgi:hypothetical protein